MESYDSPSDPVSSNNVGASSTTDDRLTDAQPTTGGETEGFVNVGSANAAPRIEVMTLRQYFHDIDSLAEHDRLFADALNEGWEILHIYVGQHMSEAPDFVGAQIVVHCRIVTLHRLSESGDAPEGDASVEETVEVEAVVDAPVLPQKPAVTLAQATASGEYSREEIRALAEHELALAGLTGAAAWEPQSNPVTGEQWESLRFHRTGLGLGETHRQIAEAAVEL